VESKLSSWFLKRKRFFLHSITPVAQTRDIDVQNTSSQFFAGLCSFGIGQSGIFRAYCDPKMPDLAKAKGKATANLSKEIRMN